MCKGGREPDQGTVLHYLLPLLATFGWSRKHGRLTKASNCLQTCLKTLKGRGGLPEEHVERAIVKSLEMRTERNLILCSTLVGKNIPKKMCGPERETTTWLCFAKMGWIKSLRMTKEGDEDEE